jgi:hypothetical protein
MVARSLLLFAFFLALVAPAAATTTLSGKISNLTTSSFLMQSGYPHGYVPVLYGSARVTGALQNGALVTAIGNLTTSGSLLAALVSVTPPTTISGPISHVTASTFTMNAGYPHGYVPVIYSSATVTGGLSNGVMASALGYMASGSLFATSVNVGSVVIPSHVRVYAFYGELGVASSVPASWMAANANFVVGPPSNIEAFHAAGGQYGIAYTDPVDVVPANYEPMWNVSEDGWFHDSTGTRVHRLLFGNVQNSLNPSANSTRSAFQALTSSIATSSRGYTFVEVDNVDWDLRSAWWHYNSSGVEIATNTAYDIAMEGLLGYSTLPTIFNGLHDNAGGLPVSGDTVFLPYSSGGLSENCMQDALGPLHDSAWLFSENTMLYTTQQHKWAICEGQSTTGSTDNRRDRTYFLASWWLTYDPNYSVAFPAFASTGSVFVFPEYQIVPTLPLQSGTTNVSSLITSTGAYARQFSACYIANVSIGGCAAVVNPSSTITVAMPSLSSSYHHILVLDTNNTYYHGLIGWTTTMPAALSPEQAVILAN